MPNHNLDRILNALNIDQDSAQAAQIASAIDTIAQDRAQQIVSAQAEVDALVTSGRMFSRFKGNDIVSNIKDEVTAGLFTAGASTITTAHTHSLQPAGSKSYYYNIAQTTSTTAATEFALSYGHRFGSGSTSINSNDVSATPTKSIYSQYRNLLLTPGDTQFSFANGDNTNDIHILTFDRARYKQKLAIGSFEVRLHELNGSQVAQATYHTLIDDSSTSTSTTVGAAGRVFNLVSGSLANGINTAAASRAYGLVYPDLGIIVFNPSMLSQSFANGGAVIPNTLAGAVDENNRALFLARSIAGPTPSVKALNSEEITSTHYFVRLFNGEYNFSNNPTYVTGSIGQIRHASFVGDPKAYVTTVGLYNDSNELLATAKMSQPLLKSFSREALIRVKLDY